MFPRLEDAPRVVVAETMAGAPGVVDVWSLALPNGIDRTRAATYERMLSAEERDRWQRFHVAADRDVFLATRGLLRTVLSQYFDIDPSSWTFGAGAQGKPFIAGPMGASQLFFNVSHIRGFALCGVSRHERIGVDVEEIPAGDDLLSIADRHFSKVEAREMRSRSGRSQQEYFQQVWTLKESYIKATGQGLSQGLDSFLFAIDPPEIRLRLEGSESGGTNDSLGWQFALLDCGENRLGAVTAYTGGVFMTIRNGGAPSIAWPNS